MTAGRARAERFGKLDLRSAPSAMEQRFAHSGPPVAPAPSASASSTRRAPESAPHHAGRIVAVSPASDLCRPDPGRPAVKPASIGPGPVAPAHFPYYDHRTIAEIWASEGRR